MKAREFFLRKDFTKWLQDEKKLTIGGVSSYVSNLAALFINYSDQLLEDAQFEALIENGNQGEILNVFVSMYTIVNEEKQNVNSLLPKSKLSDIGSALRKYEAFLNELAEESEMTDDVVESLPEIDEVKFQSFITPLTKVKRKKLNVKDIRSNFTIRLITQDRPSGNVYFPISIIKKLFYRNEHRETFDKWKDDQLDKIILHTNDGTLTLNDIKSLKIESDGSILLKCCDGQTKSLYTKLADNKTISQMYVSKFSQVVIDHVVPMKDILVKNTEKFVGLVELTKSFNIHGNINSRKDIVRIGNELLDNKYIKSQNTF